MRAFLGIALAPETRAGVDSLLIQVKSSPAWANARVSWVKSDNLHITLRFLGEIEPTEEKRIEEHLRTPCELTPFALEFGRCGTFPPRGAARVVYLDLENGASQLVELHAEVQRRLAACGVAPESRPYRPHVTLGRVRRIDSGASARAREDLGRVVAQVPATRVEEVVLFESQLTPRGSIYTPRMRTRLA